LTPQEVQAPIKLTVDLLVAELPDRHNGVRSHIARAALTRISPVVTDQLIEAFANSNPIIRDQVAYILGDSKGDKVDQKLIKALNVANDRVASGAARVLYFRGINPRDEGYTGIL
jgi:HEAT repeat protein